MNFALIFAGGYGRRMGQASIPKQFIEVQGKPIIIHTLEHFSNHPLVHGIIIACLEGYIPFLKDLVQVYNIQKIRAILPGGKTGQESICNGLEAAMEHYGNDDLVLVHDGVRPVIDSELITACIRNAEEHGNSVAACPAVETIAVVNNSSRIDNIIPREKCVLAKAPQVFRLGELHQAHLNAKKDGYQEAIDSASLMKSYGKTLYYVTCKSDNIKITTMEDLNLFIAMVKYRNKL